MHRALCIPEVVAIIVEQMWSMHDIVALARTCRTFTEPALNALWEEPPLWYLAKTMSENLWTIEISTSKLSPESAGSSDNDEAWHTLVKARYTKFCIPI
jgi:hypothetical protein